VLNSGEGCRNDKVKISNHKIQRQNNIKHITTL